MSAELSERVAELEAELAQVRAQLEVQRKLSGSLYRQLLDAWATNRPPARP